MEAAKKQESKCRGSEWKLALIERIPMGKPMVSTAVAEIIVKLDQEMGFETLKKPLTNLNLLAEQVGAEYLLLTKTGKTRDMVYTVTAPKGLDELGFRILEWEEEHPLRKKKEPKAEEPKTKVKAKIERKINPRSLRNAFEFFKLFLNKKKLNAQEQERLRGKAFSYSEVQQYRAIGERVYGKGIIVSITPNTDRRKKDIELPEPVREILLSFVNYIKANYPERIKDYALQKKTETKDEEKKENQVPSTPKVTYVTREFGELGYLIASVLRNGSEDLRIIRNKINNTSFFDYQIGITEIEDVIKKFPDIFKISNVTVQLRSWEAALAFYNPKNIMVECVWYIGSGLSLKEIKGIFPNSDYVNNTVKEIVKINLDATVQSKLKLAILYAKMREDADFLISGSIDPALLRRIYKNHLQRAMGMISHTQKNKYAAARMKYEQEGEFILSNDQMFWSIEEN